MGSSKHQRGAPAPAQGWIGLAGPTASGKSALSLALAEVLAAEGHRVEIISVDSALVYRHMDIGTAKPSAAELAQVPHHLISIREPTQAYSAAEFVRETGELIAAITARGALPLLVGGTMLYFKALMDGLDALPPANPEIRAGLEARALSLGWPAMHAELAAVDAVTAARLSPNDSQRIQRALEVFAITGKPMSTLHSTKTIANNADGGSRNLLISLEPEDRSALHARIAQRFDAMLSAGLVAEVEALRSRGDLHADLPSMRCVGYRQVWQLLESQITPEQMRETGIAATRQLAKRQITWLRSMPQRHTLACDGPPTLAPALALVRAFLGQRA